VAFGGREQTRHWPSPKSYLCFPWTHLHKLPCFWPHNFLNRVEIRWYGTFPLGSQFFCPVWMGQGTRATNRTTGLWSPLTLTRHGSDLRGSEPPRGSSFHFEPSCFLIIYRDVPPKMRSSSSETSVRWWLAIELFFYPLPLHSYVTLWEMQSTVQPLDNGDSVNLGLLGRTDLFLNYQNSFHEAQGNLSSSQVGLSLSSHGSVPRIFRHNHQHSFRIGV
jgi:hypothetical protein